MYRGLHPILLHFRPNTVHQNYRLSCLFAPAVCWSLPVAGSAPDSNQRVCSSTKVVSSLYVLLPLFLIGVFMTLCLRGVGRRYLPVYLQVVWLENVEAPALTR
ncbi:hypothetical protein BaRGS_00001651 [Batillaria attramentaria]|uniref:Uncharacterized protein n=1 Tax=Batillaria attramentaria TaxID=370345 RepID=A0ABD0M543_9CAEN